MALSTPMTASVWFVLLCALLAANLPFFTERLFGLLKFPLSIFPAAAQKTFAWRVFEMCVLYCLTGLLAIFLEARLGHIQPQRWEFYAITACLFIVFAYPGFVWRYLRRAPH